MRYGFIERLSRHTWIVHMCIICTCALFLASCGGEAEKSPAEQVEIVKPASERTPPRTERGESVEDLEDLLATLPPEDRAELEELMAREKAEAEKKIQAEIGRAHV